jgi:hypothetical protein
VNDRGDKLATIDEPEVLDNGNMIAFTVRTVSGASLRVNCAVATLGDVFSFLAELAKAAGDRRLSSPAPSHFVPIPAIGMGLAKGQGPNEVLLVIHLPGFQMAFEVQSSAIEGLADEFFRISRTLSADDTKPKN